MKWMTNYLEVKEQKLNAGHRQFGIEIRLAAQLLEKPTTKENTVRIWRHLERAHILSQASAWRHLSVHMCMFFVAMCTLNFREVLGQIPRILLAVPSSLFDLAPHGNTGRSDISMFAAMTAHKDLEKFLNERKPQKGSL